MVKKNLFAPKDLMRSNEASKIALRFRRDSGCARVIGKRVPIYNKHLLNDLVNDDKRTFTAIRSLRKIFATIHLVKTHVLLWNRYRL